MSDTKTEGLSIAESISSLLLYVFGFLSTIRGAYWLTKSEEAYRGGGIYSSLDDVAPLFVWGAIITIAGLCIVASGYFISKRQRKSSFFWLLLIGGFLAAIVYFTTSVAGINNSSNWMTSVQVVLLSAGHGMLSFIGGAELWRRKNP